MLSSRPNLVADAEPLAAPVQPARLRRVRGLALLRHALGTVHAAIVVNLAASLVVAFEIHSAQVPWAWAWFAAVVGVSALRLVAHRVIRSRLVRARATPQSLRGLIAANATGQLTAGLLWSYMGWHGLTGHDADAQLKIIIVLSAMAGGATGVLAPLRWTGPLYITELLLPGCVKLALLPSAHVSLAILGFVFLVVMVIGHRNNHRMIVQSLDLREENLDLIANLRWKNAEVEAMNHQLEDRVARRTEDLRVMAYHDALTGLHNRRGIVEGLERLMLRSDAMPGDPAGGLAVLFLDLDRFKQINDGIGHDVGDRVLVHVAARFRACMPPEAVFGRWGGDEFIAAIGGVVDAHATALAVADQLQLSLDAPIEVQGERLCLGVSIGMAQYPSHVSSPAGLIRAADLAAAEAKRQGRGRVVEFHEAMSATQRRRLEIALALRECTRDDSLHLVYQPIVDARSGRVIALEALLRWRSHTLGEVRPDEFVPVAEESDRIVEIGAWVLRQACAGAVDWDGDGPPPKVAVNVSVRQMLRADFADVVRSALAESGLPPGRLTLEVTESVFAEQHSAGALQALTQLHAIGVQIDVDDFGTGYSSLSRLHQFPLDAVKIDRSFVRVLDGPSCAIIDGTILMARRFGLLVIAEGVETREQASQLLGMGVDALQGYLLGRPHHVPRLSALQPFWGVETQAAPAQVASDLS